VVTRLSTIAPKLAKLVLMLSSDQPGEVFAASRAIERALEGIGADWFDLVGELTKPAPASSSSRSNRNRHHEQQQQGDWRPLHEYCRDRIDALSARECDFMDTLDRWRGNITEKQRAWLDGIYARLRRQEES
jgi:hypothetical protein